MKKFAIAAAVVCCCLPFIVGPAVLAMITLLFSSAAQATACDTGMSAVTDTGGIIRLPVTGSFTVTSEFGMRINPVSHIRRLHAGIDLAEQPHGGPVVAMKDGVVSAIPSGGDGGNMVFVDHGGGLESRYMHLATRSVQVGQQVHAGQRIGTEGATGAVTGPHVHWEVHVSGQPVNPRTWAAQHGITLPALGGHGQAAGAVPGGATAGTPASSSAAASAAHVSTGSPADLPARIGAFSGEQIRNAALIIKAGQAMKLDGWTITVGVMTAMGESSLNNVDHGDTVGPDSRGLFQQRSAGWGTYAQRMNPTSAATSFFTALLKVPGYHNLAPTIAAHRTQRNADPYHYQSYWAPAAQMVAKLTHDSDLLASLQVDGDVTSCAPEVTAAGLPPAPDTSCPASSSPAEKDLQPAALRALRCVDEAFPKITTMYGVGTRSGPSDHATGAAVDFMIEDYRSPAGRAYGWQVAKWARANAQSLGVTYVIFDMKIWSTAREDEGWRPYTRYGSTPDDTLAHRDHVHVSTSSSAS